MASGKGFVRIENGRYVDIGDDSEVVVEELNHSVHGLIKYIEYEFIEGEPEIIMVESESPDIADDWTEEI